MYNNNLLKINFCHYFIWFADIGNVISYNFNSSISFVKKFPTLFRDDFIFAWLEEIIICVWLLFSVIVKSLVNVVDYLEVCDRTGILSCYFRLKWNELLPLVIPSFGNQINWHSLHYWGKVIIFLENLKKLIFLIVKDLSGCKIRFFSKLFLHNRFNLFQTVKMIIIERILIHLHKLFKFIKGVRSERGMQIKCFEL